MLPTSSHRSATCNLCHLTLSPDGVRTNSEHLGISVPCMGTTHIQNSYTMKAYQPETMPATLSEVFSEAATDAAAVGYMIARLPKSHAPLLWVQDRVSCRESGRPYLAGIGTPRPIIMVNLSRAVDVLWAMEDGLRCRALGAVIGEIWGDPPVLNFTASKRLALRSEDAKIPCWIIRRAATPNLSAARDRWRIGSAPSATHPHDAQAPGQPRWSLNLFRSRQSKPGRWVVEYDTAADRFNYIPPILDRALAPGDGKARKRATG